jgi:hypothetical protein
MPLDSILVDGDEAVFVPAFGSAVVTVRPGRLKGSGPAQASGKNVCVQGDEGSVTVDGCPYITPAYSVPGMGSLSIARLAPGQVAGATESGGTPVLLLGATFTAKFQVTAPAQSTSAPPVPDPMTSYEGQGSFITTNLEVMGS